MSKIHQLTTTQLNSIAEDIYKAVKREHPVTVITTKEKQIDFMRHLSGQGYTYKQIGKVYGVSDSCVGAALQKRYQKMKTK